MRQIDLGNFRMHRTTYVNTDNMWEPSMDECKQINNYLINMYIVHSTVALIFWVQM
jgi:hypothetical protein